VKSASVASVFVLGLALTCSYGVLAQRHAQPEQREFSAEDEGVQRPVVIPQSVLDILAKDDGARNLMENEDPPLKSVPASWFSASEVHLAGPNEKDLVVVGEEPVSGGNTARFWVFRPISSGYELVLSDSAHDLQVKKKRWKGYCEIELSGATAVEFFSTTFRWDGTKYVNFREESHKIR
jgi:hypothetical protein